MRYILALSMLFCQSLCFAGDVRATIFEARNYESEYKIEYVELDDHDYIIIRKKHTDHFTIIHSPECRYCILWLQYELDHCQSCVEIQSGDRYTVDKSGCVDRLT